MIAVAIIASMWGASGRASAQDSEHWLPSQPLLEGQRLFEAKRCSSCHGIPGKPDSVRSAPDLGRGRSWRDVMDLASSLWNHAPRMIILMRDSGITRPSLSPDETATLVAYLFSLGFLDEPGDIERGRQQFEARTCSRCHQLGGRGGTVGPRLDELSGSVSSIFMAQALWNHGPEMAAKMTALGLERPRLDGDDIGNLVAFIRGQTRPAGPPPTVGDARVGKSLFREKGCIKCHAIDGSGGRIGPDLSRSPTLRNASEMSAAFWNHAPTMWNAMRAQEVRFPTLSDRDMADLMAYLYFVQYMGVPGDAAKGGVVFRNKSCDHCHMISGADRPGMSNLAGKSALRSPIQWISAMWNHAPTVDNALREMKVPWPAFQDGEMRDLVAYVNGGAASGGGPVHE